MIVSSFFSSSFSSQSDNRRPHDITSKRGLTGLYNSRVDSVEHVTRPLGGSAGSFGVKHSGVVVTTENGDRWLVHKGPGYGDSSKALYFSLGKGGGWGGWGGVKVARGYS